MKKAGHKWNWRDCRNLHIFSTKGFQFLFLTAGLVSILMGCANFPSSQKSQSEAQRIKKLESIVRTQRSKLEEVKERNLVLEERLKKRRANAANASAEIADRQYAEMTPAVAATQVPVPFEPSAALDADGRVDAFTASAQPKAAAEVKMPAPRFELLNDRPRPKSTAPSAAEVPVIQSVTQDQTGEHYLYSKILATYRVHDAVSLSKTLQILLKTYPDSVFADNSLYLAGLLALENNRAPQAKFYMERLIHEYSTGNKVVSALFTEGVIEKRAKNYRRAQQIFETVARLFPGSPEAARVHFELKLLKLVARQG